MPSSVPSFRPTQCVWCGNISYYIYIMKHQSQLLDIKHIWVFVNIYSSRTSFCSSILAPFDSRILTTSLSPFMQASIKEVVPLCVNIRVEQYYFVTLINKRDTKKKGEEVGREINKKGWWLLPCFLHSLKNVLFQSKTRLTACARHKRPTSTHSPLSDEKYIFVKKKKITKWTIKEKRKKDCVCVLYACRSYVHCLGHTTQHRHHTIHANTLAVVWELRS
jgi:hypothetical protein